VTYDGLKVDHSECWAKPQFGGLFRKGPRASCGLLGKARLIKRVKSGMKYECQYH